MEESNNMPAYVLQFAVDTDISDLVWLLKILTDKKEEGGAELLMQCTVPSADQGLMVFLSIARERMLCVASQLRFVKPDLSGNLRQFSAKCIQEFSPDKDAISLFSSADILAIIRHEIDNLRSNSKQCLSGSNINLYQGQSIVEKLLHKRFIEKIYPLHEPENLKLLSRQWYGGYCNMISIHKQPLDNIRDYFGDGLAYYFAFLHTLTMFLIFPSIIGLIHHWYGPTGFHSHLFFCVLHLLWAFSFSEYWKRQSNELSYEWGTNVLTGGNAAPRANYRGELVIDSVTGQLEPYYPRWKTLVKLYLVSVPIVIVCMLAAAWLMLESFWKEALVVEMTSSWSDHFFSYLLKSVLVAMPSLIYAVLVWLGNHVYRKLANKLTEWENHRTESQFERNRVTKVLLFEFVNNFLSLFYIAFYLRDMKNLKWQVAMMLMVFQIINHLTETLLPYVNKRMALRNNCTRKCEPNELLLLKMRKLKCTVLDSGDYRVKQAEKEAIMDPYDGTHEDYLELFIQFGYVLLFIVTYPMASLWALINNVLELRTDAFKLSRVFRRPPVARVGHIGAWQPAFRIMCSMAVVTNCALLYIMSGQNNEAQEAEPGNWHRAFICVALDHCLLALQSLLAILIPPIPNWVQIAQAKDHRLAAN